MSPEFETFRRFLKERSGLVLTPDKQYLLESRLLPVARRVGIASLAELAARIGKPGSEKLAVDVVEAMTTNESFFFRDKTPFDHYRDTMLPALMAGRAQSRRIRVWCAAASTGQEPYSLAMTAQEMGPKLAGYRIEILGTDLSNEVLEKARAGAYTQFEVQRGMPVQLLLKYFEQAGETWRIAPSIRAQVQYRQLNLLEDFRHLGQFDVIFCRNVLIYFDNETKAAVLGRMAKMLAPDGYLLLGAAETVVGITDAFRPLADKRGLYTLPPAEAAPQRPRLAAVGGMR
jgi:chemotaxis protein methyltransferase CheR